MLLRTTAIRNMDQAALTLSTEAMVKKMEADMVLDDVGVLHLVLDVCVYMISVACVCECVCVCVCVFVRACE